MDRAKEIFYDKEKKFFLYLMTYISRFFMSDEEIVVFDLFVHNECLYLEKDIVACLNLNEQKARTILSKLLREQFIVEVRKHKNDEDRSSAFQTFYCLNSYIVYVIDFRVKQMEIEIQNKKTESDIYICKDCNVTYSQMDAPTLPMDPYDAHFLCFCNKKIELIATEENNDESIYNRYTRYLNIIKEYTDKLKNYFIPMYTEKFNKSSLPSTVSAMGDENSSEVSLTNNSSEVTMTNNSSLISQVNGKKKNNLLKKKGKEENVENCSSVIRNGKKIKIRMKKNHRQDIEDSVEEIGGKTPKNLKREKNSYLKNNLLKENDILNDDLFTKKNINEHNSNSYNLHNDDLNNSTFHNNNNNNNNIFKNIETNNYMHEDIFNNLEKIDTNHIIPNNISNDVSNNCLKKKETTTDPMFFIKKHNQKYTLKEAQKFQQDMTEDEFERFVELQDVYLDDF